MKHFFKIKPMLLVCFTVALCSALLVIHLACSPLEESQFAQDNPPLAPATQALETVQQKIDPIAAKAQQGALVIQTAASDAAQLGLPGASAVALIAAAVGSILGIYNERRTGTTPLRTAVTQIVQSVESAFPTKTEPQKLALAALQDQSTQALVAAVKGK